MPSSDSQLPRPDPNSRVGETTNGAQSLDAPPLSATTVSASSANSQLANSQAANSQAANSPVSHTSTDVIDRSESTSSRTAAMALGGTDAPDGDGNVTNLGGLVVLIGLMGLLWYRGGLDMLLFVLTLVVMIFLHELGHFVTARKTGMKATRFFVGMGPTIISRTYGETEYGLKAIPAGAFVAITGMSNLDPIAPEDEPRAYKNATFPRRMLVITAGSIMHFLQAILVFVFLFSFIGLPDGDGPWTINALSKLDNGEPAPAITAGLELGDRIVSIDGHEVASFGNLSDIVSVMPGQEITLGIERDGEFSETVTTLATVDREDGSVKGFLGVGASFDENVRMSPTFGFSYFYQTFKGTFSVIGTVFSPSGFQNLGSLVLSGTEDVALDSDEAQERPVSVVGVVRIAGGSGLDWTERLAFFGAINIFIGIFNLFPLLPLDGGHAAVAMYERLRSRKGRAYHVDFAKLLPVTYVVVMVLGFMFVSTLWLDLFRPIS